MERGEPFNIGKGVWKRAILFWKLKYESDLCNGQSYKQMRSQNTNNGNNEITIEGMV
jgi:hypothetical protein